MLSVAKKLEGKKWERNNKKQSVLAVRACADTHTDSKYFRFNEQQLFDCIHTNYDELCDIMSPLHVMNYTQDCEISLLMHANLPHPKSCNVILEAKNAIVSRLIYL